MWQTFLPQIFLIYLCLILSGVLISQSQIYEETCQRKSLRFKEKRTETQINQQFFHRYFCKFESDFAKHVIACDLF